MMWMLALSFLLMLVYFKPDYVISLVNSFVKIVPLGHAAIRTRLGKFSAKKKAGPMVALPVIHGIKVVPLDLPFRVPGTAKVQTLDGDSLDVLLAFEYKADFDLLETYYYAMERGKEHFENMILSSIVNLTGNLASTKTLDQFYKQREALWMALNCYSRMSVMPHIDPSMVGRKTKKVKNEKILDFYDSNKKKVAELISHEEENREDRSEIELRYGVNIMTVDVSEVKFSKETQDAINRKKRDQAMTEAASFKKKLIKDFQEECKLSPEAAKQAAEASLGQTTENRAFSVLGLKDIIRVDLGGKSNG